MRDTPWQDFEDYEIGGGDLLPRDWKPELRSWDERRQVRRLFRFVALLSCLSLIFAGGVVWWVVQHKGVHHGH